MRVEVCGAHWQMAFMKYQRKHPRASIQTEIWLGQDGIFTRSPETLRDLSEGGAFVETKQRFPVGDILHLRFQLPGASSLISCSVCVRNLRGGTGLGVEFLDISPDDRQQIRNFVESQLSHRSK
jgi:c-di-GMP-binding flagellar brake protein YcgR